MTLIKSLVSGGMTPELEIILAEGAGLQPGYSCAKVLDNANDVNLDKLLWLVCASVFMFPH